MTDIRVPKLNNNDTSYVLVEWLVEDGQEIKAGDPIAVLETSKAAEELVSDADGHLWHAVALNADCTPGSVLAHVGDTRPGVSEEPVAEGPLITAPAQSLIDELGLDLAAVRALGVPVVRRSDIERLVSAGHRLSRVQRAVARAVRTSHETIPAAYTVVTVDVGAALDLAAQLTREVRRPVGLPELVTCAVARLHEAFPLFYATILDDDSARLADAPHIGVTMDAGAGLYVPVVHDAGRRTVKEVAARLMEYRLAAVNGDFREDDLAGANIAVTLHHDGDITLAIPLIFPGHVCALAVASPSQVLALVDGEIGTRTVATIGLAYDHRLINGRDAGLYLRALKDLLQTSEVFR